MKAYTRDYAEWDIKVFENKCKTELASACLTTRITGEPYSGNLYLRFDEDSGNKLPELLYWLKKHTQGEKNTGKLPAGPGITLLPKKSLSF